MLNATGVVLHTNLGRAPLSAAAVEALVAAAGTTDVELDLATGRRARRGRGALAALAAAVPAAEAVHVVNNGAAALVLAATALAAGREIVVSRGELVEIGDGFRLPDLLASTGARLREVGTTNRTHPRRLRATPSARETGFVLKVHPSNFVVTGFTRSVGGRPSSPTARPCPSSPTSARACSRPTRCCPTSPTRPARCAAGADLVTASGDKLLGGPQAGLLLGRAELVERLRRHPLARALRVDKLTLAALEATLTGPRTPTAAGAARPTARRCAARAGALAARLVAGRRPAPCVVPSDAVVGGGGAPGTPLPSCRGGAAAGVRRAAAHRRRPPVARAGVERGRLLLDLRCRARRRTTTRSPLAVLARPLGGRPDVRRRHRRARRPRQVHARPRAHRHGARPLGGGAPPGHDHRPRLRLDDAARRARSSRSSTSRATSGSCQHARRRRPGAGGAARRGRRRGLDAADRRARRRARRARRPARRCSP